MDILPFCTLDTPCPYLDDRGSRTEYMYIFGCDFNFNSNLVKHGYRRFGRYFQKPVCVDCNECQSIRVDVENFKLSRSQRRVMSKNSATRYLYTKPIVDDEHLALFRKYHLYMRDKKKWKYYEINLRRYYYLYVLGFGDFGKEISYYSADGRLICVDLIDIVEDGISSIYCYYDPDFLELGLGKFSLLKEIDLARELKLKWLYLGYYVKDCASLNYKDKYKPYQTLLYYNDIKDRAIWEFKD